MRERERENTCTKLIYRVMVVLHFGYQITRLYPYQRKAQGVPKYISEFEKYVMIRMLILGLLAEPLLTNIFYQIELKL